MRTARSSSLDRGVSTTIPRDQAPLWDQAPPGPDTSQIRHPPPEQATPDQVTPLDQAPPQTRAPPEPGTEWLTDTCKNKTFAYGR